MTVRSPKIPHRLRSRTLIIDGHQIPLASITDVHASSSSVVITYQNGGLSESVSINRQRITRAYLDELQASVEAF